MPDATLPNPDSPFATLFNQLVDMGGPAMVALIVIAVIGLVAFFYLMLFGSLYAPRMTAAIRRGLTHWQQHPSTDCPRQLEQNASRYARLNPLHQLVTGAMRTHLGNQDSQQAREIVARDAGKALEPFEAPLKIIEVIAALAPLLGLLGTVMGMMEAFSAMAATEGRANASQLSGGIYEALTTTAAGLVVAIPFAALAAWIEFRMRRLHKQINSVLVTVLAVSPGAESGAATEQPPEPSTKAASVNANNPRAEPTGQYGGLAHAAG